MRNVRAGYRLEYGEGNLALKACRKRHMETYLHKTFLKYLRMYYRIQKSCIITWKLFPSETLYSVLLQKKSPMTGMDFDSLL